MSKVILNHTALRGITALVVFWGHYTNVFSPEIFLPHTHLGVDVFFILSGFILYYVYGRVFTPVIHARDAGIFLLRRLLRIYPLHLLTLLMVIALMRLALPEGGGRELVLNLTLTHAWGLTDSFVFNAPSWSISAEWAAYLAFPLLALLVGRKAGPVLLLALSGVSAVALWRLGSGSLDLDAIGRGHVLLRVGLGFPLGVVLGWIFATKPKPDAQQASLMQGAALLTISTMLWAGLPELFLILPISLLVFATAGDNGKLAPILANPVLQRLGTISYGIYLLQWPLILLMFNIDSKLLPYFGADALNILRPLILLPLLLGLASLSWRWIEAPAMALGRRPSAQLA